MQKISDLPDVPRYPIRAVSQRTGIRPVTIRAWERRYGLVTPQRDPNRYRRYSERDIACLMWVRARIQQGLSAGEAANEIKRNIILGDSPTVDRALLQVPSRPVTEPPQSYVKSLLRSLIAHDSPRARTVLQKAQEALELPIFLEEVVTPTLVEIGEAWHRGEIRISTEHFATSLIRSHLEKLFFSLPVRRSSPHIVCACAPYEHHEVGILVLSVLLRHAGLKAEYLGADLPVEDLIDYAADAQPVMILLSATLEKPALGLVKVQARLSTLAQPPLFGYGGRAFIQNPSLREKIPGLFLGESASKGVEEIKRLLASNGHRV